MSRRIRILVVALALVLGACSKDNPVAPGPGNCDHADADGLVVEQGSAMLAAQWQATVVGGFALADTQTTDPFAVTFLSPDSVRLAPGDFCSHSLRGEIADTTFVRLVHDAGNPWGFSLRGKAAGSTTLRLRIWHNDHADFTSQPIPITVSGTPPHAAIGAYRTVLFKGGSRVASWRWGVTGSYGKLYAPIGATTWPIGVQWLDSLETVLAPFASYSLGWTVTNPAIATFSAVPGQPFQVRMQAHAAGATQVTFSLLWNGTPELTTGPLDVVVDDTTATPSQSVNFVLRKSGVRHIFVENGVIVPSCGATASTGFLPARADTIEDLFSFRITTPPSSCSGTTPGSGSIYSLVYEFGVPDVAGIVAHPEHVGEYFDFHFRGLALGSTPVRLVLFNGNSVAFRSPWMPVVVTNTGSAPLAAREAGRDD